MCTFSEHRVISSSKHQKQALKKGLALNIFLFLLLYLPIKISILFNSFCDKSFCHDKHIFVVTKLLS